MTLADVLATWGVVPDRVRLIQDRGNAHWAVAAAFGQRYVLRRYGPHRQLLQVEWEHDLLRRLADRGWPVAHAIGPPLAADDRIYSLFPFVGGLRIRGADVEQRRRCGRLLAEFHRDVAALGIEARPDEPKIWEFGPEPILDYSDTLGSVIGTASASLFVRHAAEVADAFERFDVRAFPRSIVHRDLSPWNLRFTRGRLSALYDFDAADVDARAADVACGRRGYHDVFVDGYREVMLLSGEEFGALGSLWRANVLRYVTDLLRTGVSTDEWDVSELEWCREQLDKTVPYVAIGLRDDRG